MFFGSRFFWFTEQMKNGISDADTAEARWDEIGIIFVHVLSRRDFSPRQ